MADHPIAEKHIDELSGVDTTGHEWDGIRELNNPLPRWWLWTFYACIAWAAVYSVLYPAWPLIHGATPGILGYSSRGEFATDMNAAKTSQAAIVDKIAAMPVTDIAADPTLSQFAIAGGAATFKVNCTPCHGTGAAGGQGYPNLNDDDWLWGGNIDAIYQTVQHGIRDPADPETRVSEMPAFGEVLQPDEIKQVAAYVISLTGKPHDASLVEPGKQVFADNCAACHGEKAEGNRDMGAPALADAIWLKVHGEDGIAGQIRMPKHGVMPAWETRLGDVAVKQLAIYIHSLGGGE